MHLSDATYFEPFEYRVFGLEDAQYADYILTDYEAPVEDNGWLVGTAEFDVRDLYIKDKKLSITLNARHLSDPLYENYTIPIDWVNVSIKRKGILS